MTGSDAPFYSYESRDGILSISWQDFAAITRGLALAVAPWEPEIILGVARGGLYPATLLSHLLRAELYPIRITSRVRDEVVTDTPFWLVRPPEVVAGRRVLVVDEICSEGRTLRAVLAETEELGAAETRTAVMYAHSWGAAIPDYIGLVSDALIVNPWDREIVQDGALVPHPEYLHALGQQNLPLPESFDLGIGATRPARTPNGQR